MSCNQGNSLHCTLPDLLESHRFLSIETITVIDVTPNTLSVLDIWEVHIQVVIRVHFIDVCRVMEEISALPDSQSSISHIDIARDFVVSHPAEEIPVGVAFGIPHGVSLEDSHPESVAIFSGSIDLGCRELLYVNWIIIGCA